jgi:hypothetical protein
MGARAKTRCWFKMERAVSRRLAESEGCADSSAKRRALAADLSRQNYSFLLFSAVLSRKSRQGHEDDEVAPAVPDLVKSRVAAPDGMN